MLKAFCLLVLSVFFLPALQGQGDPMVEAINLADQYFSDQEYQKVLATLEPYQKDIRRPKIYAILFDTYRELGDYREAEKLARFWSEQMRGRAPRYQTDLYLLHLSQEDERKAERVFDDLLEKLEKNPSLAYSFGKEMNDRGYPAQALKIYEKALAVNPDFNFDYQLALIYGELGQVEEMYRMYVRMVERNAAYLNTVKVLLSRAITDDSEAQELESLKALLIERIQAGATQRLNELLIHVFVQQKDFAGAFAQLRALDRRDAVPSSQLLQLAQMAQNNEEWRSAQRIFDYLIAKGEEDASYPRAVLGSLAVAAAKLEQDKAGPEAWTTLLSRSESYRKVFKGQPYYGPLVLQMAPWYAYRVGQLDTAEALLRDLMRQGYLGKSTQASAQIALADLLLYRGLRWDAIVFYRKAERAFEQSELGQEAKFKRAKAAYYAGEFEWAQGIFSVLKESTSKLIANDAMRYSLLITDNMALDSTTEALQTYASADLHYFRDQADSALRLLEILDVAYQEHPIHDEALFLRAKIHAEQNEPEQAVVLWERVHQEHGEGILADDALFAQADVLQQELGRQDEAMALYQELFTRYTDSFFAAEARKRYRQLRGDQNN